MYLDGKKKIIPDDLFIVINIRKDHHMDAEKFEGLLYNFFHKYHSIIREVILKSVIMI